MTNEDKKLIADYMGYEFLLYDLNDAGLCVQEMQKRGDWEHNFMDYVAGSQTWNYHQCIAWLFNAENFFGAMAQWLKEVKK